MSNYLIIDLNKDCSFRALDPIRSRKLEIVFGAGTVRAFSTFSDEFQGEKY